jgi:hypothetical protein
MKKKLCLLCCTYLICICGMDFDGLYPRGSAPLSILRDHNKTSKIPIQDDKEILISHHLPLFGSRSLECYAALWYDQSKREVNPFLLFLPMTMKAVPSVFALRDKVGDVLFYKAHWTSCTSRSYFKDLLYLYGRFMANPSQVLDVNRGILFSCGKICPTFCKTSARFLVEVQ